MHIIAALRPTAGLFDDMEREDTDLGPMPDEDDAAYQQLVPVASTISTARCMCGFTFEDCRGCPAPSGCAQAASALAGWGA